MMLISRNTFSKLSNTKNVFIFKFKSLSLSKKYFSQNVIYSPTENFVIPEVTVSEWMYAKMEPFHKYTAVECAETNKKYTFEQVRIKSNNLCNSLRKCWNLNNGDVVGIYLSNCPDFYVACLGTLEAGLVITTINSCYKSDEISKQLLDSRAKIIIAQPQNINEAKEACRKIKKNLPIISIKIKENDSLPEGVINFEELINSKIHMSNIIARKPDNLAFLPYSSGTTGIPKGVELTHKNLVATASQLIHSDYNVIESLSDSFQETVAGVLPLYHIYGFTMIQLHGLATGLKVLTIPKFTPDSFISMLKNHSISIMYAVPPLISFLTNHPEVKSKYLRHLKFILCGAAPLGILDENRFKEKVRHRFHMVQGFGMTETTGLVTCMSHKKFLDHLYKYKGSSGVPVPNTCIKIINPDDQLGTPLGRNESGELLLQSPQVMKGYFNKPDETQNTFLDGWLRTGDIGHINEDGMLYITDRLKEIIKVKGFQVSPAELEELIRDFPLVEDAAVIGVPHPTFGQVPRAYIVKKTNKTVLPEDVQQFVATKVAKYKHLLGGVEIVDKIPKSATGKILRKILKQEYNANNN